MSNPCVLICTWAGGREWLTNLYNSIAHCKYPIVSVTNAATIGPEGIFSVNFPDRTYLYNREDEFEIGALKMALKYTDYDEFFLVQDTCQFKNLAILDILFKDYEGKSIQWGHRFQSYLGKYRREILEKMTFPVIASKWDSMVQEEEFTSAYKALDSDTVELFPQWSDFIGVEVEFMGRKNLKLENDYLIKWKGTYVR